MGRMDILIPDGVENRFRVRVVQLYGGERGALSKAVKEAIELWLAQHPDSTAKR